MTKIKGQATVSIGFAQDECQTSAKHGCLGSQALQSARRPDHIPLNFTLRAFTEQHVPEVVPRVAVGVMIAAAGEGSAILQCGGAVLRKTYSVETGH